MNIVIFALAVSFLGSTKFRREARGVKYSPNTKAVPLHATKALGGEEI
jgi:hypothetical protein